MAGPLLCVVGPTASGKSALGVKLAEAYDGEILSADSVQVYRYFDIGTGKPSPEERARAPHHLIDVFEPKDTIDAAAFAELGSKLIDEIRNRGRRPIVCGGTFLWVRALVFGLAEAPPGNPELRERHRQIAESEGRDALHRALALVDPESANRLNPNDFVRVSRALEVHELSGKAMSEWQHAHGFRQARYDLTLVGIRHEPEVLERRIRERASQMLERGWLDEVRELQRRGFGDTRAMGSVGYKQVARALAKSDLDASALCEEIVRATRIFARRQRTWLRDREIRWLSAAEAEGSVEQLGKALGLE